MTSRRMTNKVCGNPTCNCFSPKFVLHCHFSTTQSKRTPEASFCFGWWIKSGRTAPQICVYIKVILQHCQIACFRRMRRGSAACGARRFRPLHTHGTRRHALRNALPQRRKLLWRTSPSHSYTAYIPRARGRFMGFSAHPLIAFALLVRSVFSPYCGTIALLSDVCSAE